MLAYLVVTVAGFNAYATNFIHEEVDAGVSIEGTSPPGNGRRT
ncbi:hypothetical protein ACUN24_13040 [Pedobacter sp. WC2501]